MTKKKILNMPLHRVTVEDHPGKGPGGSTPPYFWTKLWPDGKKNFLKTGPPPLSDGLDPPLCYTITNHKLVVIISPLTEANVKTLPELYILFLKKSDNYIILYYVKRLF